MIKIGVVIPVYNAEKYLKKCIDSILAQSFQEFELTLVDDGSTDRSGKICDEYAEKYEKIKVIHNSHLGVSEARNRGVDENTGEYITFVDSDDWIEERYLEILYQLIIEFQADLVISSGIDIIEGRQTRKKKIKNEQTDVKSEVISKAEAYRRMLLVENNTMVVPWAKLYHRKLFQLFRYPSGEIYEDVNVIDRIIEGCEKIVYTSYVGYFYLKRKGSIIHGKMSDKHMVSIKNAERLWEFIKDYYPEIEDAAKLHYLRTCFGVLNRMLVDPGYQRECREMRKKIIEEERFLLFCSYADFLEWARAICLLIGIPWYRFVWKFYLWWTGNDSGTEIM